MSEEIVGVRVVVKMASAAGNVYWRSGEGKTLREALVRVVTVGKNGGGRMRPECKEMVKGQLCWAELGLKERDSEKARTAGPSVKSSSVMDAEFLGGGKDRPRLVIRARGRKVEDR